LSWTWHAQFESLATVSYSPSIVTVALTGIISEIKPYIGKKSRSLHPVFKVTLYFDAEYQMS